MKHNKMEKSIQHTFLLIQKTAMTCFANNGYGETTIRIIAKEANISPGTIYTYFKSKKELFDSLNIPEMELVRPEYEKKRIETIRAALILLGDKGFEGTTMDEIASAVGISKASLYLYFDGKEDLFAQVLHESALNIFSKKILNYKKNSNWEAEILEIGRSYLKISNDPERIALLRSVIRDSSKFPNLGEIYYEQGFNAACNDVVQYLKNVKDDGFIKIREEDMTAAVHTYFGALQSFILMNNIISGIHLKFTAEKYLEIATNVFLRGIKQI